jgi:hypothetical protein
MPFSFQQLKSNSILAALVLCFAFVGGYLAISKDNPTAGVLQADEPLSTGENEGNHETGITVELRKFEVPGRAVQPVENVDSEPSSSSTPSVTFLVEEESGIPIQGANIRVVPPGGSGKVEDTETDATGFAVIESGSVLESTVVVSKTGFASRTVLLPASPAELYGVILAPGFTLKGTLSLADGGSVPEDSSIFVWQEGQELGNGLAAGTYAACGTRYSAEVSPDGTFEVTGLDPQLKYGVSAYGGGIVVLTKDELRKMSVPSEGSTIVAHYLYGAVIKSGPRFPNFSSVLESSSVQWGPRRGDPIHRLEFFGTGRGDVISSSNWSIVLAGLSAAGPSHRATPKKVFFATDKPMKPPIECEYFGGLEGYSAQTGRFPLARAKSLEELTVAFLEPSQDFPEPGSIALHIGNEGVELDFPAARKIPPQFVLVDRDRAGDIRHYYTAEWDSETGCYLAGSVRPGNYLMRLIVRETSVFVPPKSEDMIAISVKSGSQTIVSVPRIDLSTLEVELPLKDRVPYLGPAKVFVMVLRPGDGATYTILNPDEHTFDRPPYRVGPFPPGEYFVKVKPMGLQPKRRARMPVRLKPGHNRVVYDD